MAKHEFRFADASAEVFADLLNMAGAAAGGPGGRYAEWAAFRSDARAAFRKSANGFRSWRPPESGWFDLGWHHDGVNRRHVRAVVAAGDDRHQGSFKRPNHPGSLAAWMYPGHLVYRVRGQSAEWLAICACGNLGPPAALAWAGDCCGPCHDRRFERGDHGNPPRVLDLPDDRTWATLRLAGRWFLARPDRPDKPSVLLDLDTGVITPMNVPGAPDGPVGVRPDGTVLAPEAPHGRCEVPGSDPPVFARQGLVYSDAQSGWGARRREELPWESLSPAAKWGRHEGSSVLRRVPPGPDATPEPGEHDVGGMSRRILFTPDERYAVLDFAESVMRLDLDSGERVALDKPRRICDIECVMPDGELAVSRRRVVDFRRRVWHRTGGDLGSAGRVTAVTNTRLVYVSYGTTAKFYDLAAGPLEPSLELWSGPEELRGLFARHDREELVTVFGLRVCRWPWRAIIEA